MLTSMKKLLLLLLITFISTKAFAVVGHTYYCEIENAVGLSISEGVIPLGPERFKFTREKKEIVFSGHYYLDGITIPTDKRKKTSTSFSGGNSLYSFMFVDMGKFGSNYSTLLYTEITQLVEGPSIIAIMAECSSTY